MERAASSFCSFHAVCSLALLLLAQPVKAAPFEVNFSQGVPTSLFDPEASGAAGVPELDASESGMVLPAKLSSIFSRPLPVEAASKYRLQIKAALSSDFVIEKNSRAHILTLLSPGNEATSRVTVIFQDSEGKELPGIGMITPEVFFLTAEPHLYTTVFYTPPGAASLKLRFIPNRRLTLINTISLELEREELSINPNPDFRYGELSYSGWKPGRDGRLYTRPDGKVVLAPGYGGRSSQFLLTPGKRYDVLARGQGGTVRLTYFGEAGQQVSSRFLIRPTAEGATTDFVPPEGVVSCRLELFGTDLLEELRVTSH